MIFHISSIVCGFSNALADVLIATNAVSMPFDIDDLLNIFT
jgi:hypothetical protein